VRFGAAEATSFLGGDAMLLIKKFNPETACLSEMSVSTNKITRNKDSENCYLNNSVHENLKSYVVTSLFFQHFYPFLFSSTGVNEGTNL
jgi:hypothetical protein